VTLTNTGSREGDEVVFIFHQPLHVEVSSPLPAKQLISFERCNLGRGTSTQVTFTVSASELGLVDDMGNTNLYPGLHVLHVSRGHGKVLSQNVTVQVSEPLLIETLLDHDSNAVYI